MWRVLVPNRIPRSASSELLVIEAIVIELQAGLGVGSCFGVKELVTDASLRGPMFDVG